MDQFPILDAATSKPLEYRFVRGFLADGSEEGVTWTGRVWWGSRNGVEVVRWQEIGPMPGDAEADKAP